MLAIGILGAIKSTAGAIITTTGNLLGAAVSGLGGLITSLGTISIPSALPVIAVAATPIGVAVVTTIAILNISAAFLKEPFGSVLPPVPTGSAYINISKMAYFEGSEVRSITSDEIKEGSIVVYRIIVAARQKNLTNIKAEDHIAATLTSPKVTIKIENDINGNPIGPWKIDQLAVNANQEINYSISVPKSKFDNSLIINNVQVSAEAINSDGNKTNEQSNLSFSLVIGQPPFSPDTILYWAQEIAKHLNIGLGVYKFWNRLLDTITNGFYTITGNYPAVDTNDPPGDIYWCTYLIIDAYRLAGVLGLSKSSHGGVSNMENYFRGGTGNLRYVDYENNPQRLSAVKAGDVMFIYNTPHAPPPDGHVALVTSINVDSKGDGFVSLVQSNSSIKETTYPVVGWQVKHPTGRKIVAFGGI